MTWRGEGHSLSPSLSRPYAILSNPTKKWLPKKEEEKEDCAVVAWKRRCLVGVVLLLVAY